MFWEFLWKIKMKARYMKCWFLGHKKTGADRWTHLPDFCAICLVEWPQDKKTLWHWLNRSYCWMVGRRWRWFDALDVWLLNKHAKHLPSWWEY
jgi:hypothetical protein